MADDKAIVTRDTTDAMSMTELVQWMGVNFGTIGVRDALQQAAFMLCCDVISQDVAKAPLRMMERLSNGTARVVMPDKHVIAAMLAMEPNRWHTWYEFTEMLVLWMCLTRNGYAYAPHDNKGDPIELVPVQSANVIEMISGRELFYDITASTQFEQMHLGAPYLRVPERDMLHVRSRLLDGMDGYSTLVAGRTTLETGGSIEDFRGDLFSESGQLRGVFRKKGAGAVDDQAFQRLRAQLKVAMSRMKAATDPLVLEDDMEFQAISSKPSEMELTDQFRTQVVNTARLLRVPPHKLFELDGAKYENMETQEKMYVGDTLVPIATPIEQRLGKVLLSGKDRLRFFFEYDREAMTLRDTKAETERAVKAMERGGITIDEFRARLGYNPLDNGQGETRLIPANMIVVDAKGNVVISASNAKPEPSDAAEPDASPAPGDATKTALRIVSSK